MTQEEQDMAKYDTDFCLCGKRVILTNGEPSQHHPKRLYQPRFFLMTRKERKAMWCDIWKRLEGVTQTVHTFYKNEAFEQLNKYQDELAYALMF